MKISKETLRDIIGEELKEGIAASRLRASSAHEIADSLVHLKKVMIHLLNQKRTTEPGSEAHDKATRQIAQIAAVAQEYAYRSDPR